MGKGAFRGSLHFCGQARQSARTRSKRPFPASRRRGSGDRPPHFPAGRQAGRQAEGVPAFIRSPAFGPTDTRIGIRLPSPAAGQTDTRFIRQTRARVAPDRDAPGHPCLPTTRPGRGRASDPGRSDRPGHRRPTLICQQPARPRASLRTRLTRLTGTPPPHPDSPTTRPGRGRTPSGPDRANMLPCLPDLPAPRHDHGHDRGCGFHPPAGADRDCGIGCRTCKKSAAPGPARRPGVPEKGRKPRIHICICLPFKFLSPSLASGRRRKPLSFKFMFLLIVDYVS